MSPADKILFFFSALGAFNGFILGIYFLFFTTKKNTSTYFLGALLIVLSIRIGKSVAYFFDYNLPRIYLQIGLTACLFIGPLLYFFIRSERAQVKKIPSLWMGQIIGWLVLVLTIGLIYPYQHFPKIWGYYIIPLIYLQWGVYLSIAVIQLIPLFKKITRKEQLPIFEKWVLTICGAVFLFYASYIWSFFNITKGSYIGAALFFSLILYSMIFILLYRKKTDDLSSFSTQKATGKKISSSDARLIIDRLEKAMTEKELFKNPDLKVNDLASSVKVPVHQLSQVLNDHAGKNFTQFVNEYRISEACKILSPSNNLSLDAIAGEVGFNSKSTFFASFKKIKGMTPGEWQLGNSTDL